MLRRFSFFIARISSTVLVALVILGFFAERHATQQDADKFRAPPIESVKRGFFREIRSNRFDVAYLEAYHYAVPAELRAHTTKHITLDGWRPRNWHSYVPETVADDAPVVILFHGAGRSGLAMIDMWKDTADKNGIVLVAPNAPGTYWPLDDFSPTYLDKIINKISQTTNIDTSRMYLFGHSIGAIHAQLLANKTLGPWRGVAGHGGYASPSSVVPHPNAVPQRIYLGEHETEFPVAPARTAGQDLAAKGYRIDLVVIPKHTHWFYDIGPQIADHAWQWFASL